MRRAATRSHLTLLSRPRGAPKLLGNVPKKAMMEKYIVHDEHPER